MDLLLVDISKFQVPHKDRRELAGRDGVPVFQILDVQHCRVETGKVPPFLHEHL